MATLLPNGKQQFFDANGNPLAGGSVSNFIPNTSTPKDTWQDSGSTVLNTNPITLDAAGEAIIYGSGVYRQVVKDAGGNTIWDQITADTATGGLAWGGTSTGTPNSQVIATSSFTQQDGQQISFIAGFTNTSQLTVNGIPLLQDISTGPTPLSGGEVVAANVIEMIYDAARGAFHFSNQPVSYGTTAGTAAQGNDPRLIPVSTVLDFAGSTAPTGYLLCFGQAISRTTFAALFAAVSTAYGVGDGSTTFNIPDGRGRIGAGKDDMGGVVANRLTTAASGVNGVALGATGGEQAHALIIAELAAHTHPLTLQSAGGNSLGTPPAYFSGDTALSGISPTATTSSTGSGTAHNNVQPTIVFNKIIKT